MKLLGALFLAAAAFAARGDAPAWVTSAAAIPTPESAKSARAVVLLDSTTITVGRDLRILHRRAVRLLSGHVGDLALPSIAFSREAPLRSFRGWSVSRAGEVTDVRERDGMEVSSTESFELYNDTHVKALPFPSTDAGTVVVYESDQIERPDFMQTTWDFQGGLPVANAELNVSLPANWTYDAHWFRHAAVAPESPAPSLVWRLRDVPAIEEEPHMPNVSAVAGRLAIQFTAPGVTQKQTWDDVARWYDGLAAPRCISTPELQAKVRELAPETAAPLDRIRALAAFAQRDVRYVAIEIGIGGYRPHPAADIFSKRYGDCKDKVTLLRTMLHEAGIESYYVVLNATPGVVDPSFPGVDQFNHVIAAIRLPSTDAEIYATADHPKLGKLLFFDPTSSVTPLGLLPADEEGAHGLLVTGGGGELVVLPSAPPRANQLRRTAKLKLDADGTLRGEIAEVRTGALAADAREALRGKTDNQRHAWLDATVGYALTKADVTGATFEHVDDNRGDLVIRYTLVAHDYAAHAAEMTLVRPRVIGQKADPQIDATRKQPYMTDGTALQVDDVEIAIPAALKLDELPPPVRLSIAPLNYTSEAKFDGAKLTWHREYTLQEAVVDPAQVPELNRAFAKIASDERSTAVFVAK